MQPHSNKRSGHCNVIQGQLNVMQPHSNKRSGHCNMSYKVSSMSCNLIVIKDQVIVMPYKVSSMSCNAVPNAMSNQICRHYVYKSDWLISYMDCDVIVNNLYSLIIVYETVQYLYNTISVP